jgi:hypothetical protein
MMPTMDLVVNLLLNTKISKHIVRSIDETFNVVVVKTNPVVATPVPCCHTAADAAAAEAATEEEIAKVVDKNGLERQLQRIEEENMMLQRQVQDLQNQLGECEQQHAQR